ncbi:VanZ family protein [Nocardia sp. NPDC051052]|uniref:VanZ family protein n=1 Tax=Nocardia sp. NPDC051052 TaxID=3364322 RepID=UPI0037B2BA04
MNGTWETWGGVVLAAIAALPPAGVAAWWLARRYGWRPALCDVGTVVGTAPWLWMILTPTGSGRSLNLVPLRDLAEQLTDDRVIEQFGGNLLVFAALGFLLPVRLPWFTRPYRILLAAAGASIAVESMQFALAIGRHSSIDDVLLNAIGAYLAGQLSRHWWIRHRGHGRRPLAGRNATPDQIRGAAELG